MKTKKEIIQEQETITLFRHTYGSMRENLGFYKGLSLGLGVLTLILEFIILFKK